MRRQPKKSKHIIRKTFGVLIAVAYIVSPVDFIPDAMPFVGTIDDATMGALLIKLFSK